ncbi:MAG: beta-lactamase family protein, partial [Candidatus Thermoplasmatota archaeon]|nr:beta-lactamase family protein [Candidatus Thermoplasmatota archaeon]
TTAESLNKNNFNKLIENQSINDIIFNAKLISLLRIGQYPSASIGIIKNDELVWSETYGFSNVWLRQKADEKSIYMIGSTTKPITATALMQLYEQGRFDLNDDINNYLPFELRNPKYPEVPITFRMLLSHSSSIYDYCIFKIVGLLDVLKFMPFPENIDGWLTNVLIPGGKFYRPSYWLDFAPGTMSTYSSIGYLVIGCLVEKISGMKIADYCEKNIFQPLEMFNTSYDMNRLNQENMVTPYFRKMGLYLPLPQYNPACFTIMGGVRSTSNELSHFLIAHMNNGTYKGVRILKNETIELMHNTIYIEAINNFTTLRRNRTYGLGWFSWDFLKFKTEGHCGMQPGAVCFMLTNKEEKTGFVLLSNHFDVLGFFEPKTEIKDRCMQQIGHMLFEKAKEY